jgi:hypothetical protein
MVVAEGFVLFVDMGWGNLDWRGAGQALPQGSIPIYEEVYGHAVDIFADCVDEMAFNAVLGEARFENTLWAQTQLRIEDAPLYAGAVFDNGQTALHRLVAFGRYEPEIVIALVSAGLDINKMNQFGHTALDDLLRNDPWKGQTLLGQLLMGLGAKTSIELDWELDAQQ